MEILTTYLILALILAPTGACFVTAVRLSRVRQEVADLPVQLARSQAYLESARESVRRLGIENTELRRMQLVLVDRVTLMQQQGMVASPTGDPLEQDEEKSWVIDNDYENQVERQRRFRHTVDGQ